MMFCFDGLRGGGEEVGRGEGEQGGLEIGVRVRGRSGV